MKTSRAKFLFVWPLLLIGAGLLLMRGSGVVGAQGNTIGITGADFARTVQTADATALRDSLQTVLPRIVIEFADKNRQEILSYPVGMVGDVTAPNLTNLQVSVNAANRSATITWLTDEFAQTILSYGRQPGAYDQAVTDVRYAKQHTTLITNLTLGNYYFIIRSTDRDGNQSTTVESTFIVADAPTPAPTLPPGVQLRAIQPAEGVTSQATNVTISGSGFAAGMTVSLQRGTQRQSLNAVTVTSAAQLQATVPANLPAGLYDLVVQSSAGQRAVLANAFSVLAGAPQVLDVLPNQGVSDLPNEISIHGFNFAVGAVARLGETLLPTVRVNGNQVWAAVPAGLAAGRYDVVVVNPDTQQGVLTKGYAVYDSTSNNDLFGYGFELWSAPGAPRSGEPTQIGLLIHRRGGKDALADIKVRFLLGNGSGATLGEATLPFLDPAKGFDSTPPLDVTFPATGEIILTAVIDPDNLIVEDNEANNVITRTLTVAAPGADLTPPVVTDIQINGGAPQTSDTATNVAVSATDPTPNPSGLKSAYLVEYVFNSAANHWVPIQQSGWLPYEETPDYYGWNLRPIAGMHYLQVRALDEANNISVGAARAQISYSPPSDTLGRGQTRIYRYIVAAGQQLLVRLEPISGDPDLYVWSSNVAQSARVSNNEQGNEQVLVPAGEVVAGTYQIEVYGYTTTEYRLIVEIGTPAVGAASLARQPQVTTAKTPPTAPVLPVTNTPDDRQGAPPSPPTGQSNALRLFLPLVRR